MMEKPSTLLGLSSRSLLSISRLPLTNEICLAIGAFQQTLILIGFESKWNKSDERNRNAEEAYEFCCYGCP